MKKSISILSILTMLLSNLLPIGVFAEEPEIPAEGDSGVAAVAEEVGENKSSETDETQTLSESDEPSQGLTTDNNDGEDDKTDGNEEPKGDENAVVENAPTTEEPSELESSNENGGLSLMSFSQVPEATVSAGEDENCFVFSVTSEGVLTGVEVLNNSCDTVRIPSTVNTIGDWAWFGNLDPDTVHRVIVPDSVTTIKQGAFYHLPSHIEVVLGTGIRNIEDQAFQIAWDKYNDGERRHFSLIDLPNVSSIGKLAFQYAIIDDLRVNGDEEGLTIIELAFQDAQIKNIELNNVKKIESTAFIRVQNVESIAITGNDNGATVENLAFQYMGTSQNTNGDLVLSNIKYIGSGAFYNFYNQPYFNNINIAFIDNSDGIGQQSFANMSANNVIINNVKNIGWLAFQGVTINNKLTINGSNDGVNIGENAFGMVYGPAGQSEIKEIEINNAKEIVRWAFKDVQTIDNIRINGTGDGLSIGDNAFENTTINSGVYMDNVSYLGSGIFLRVNQTNNNTIDNLIITGSDNGMTIATYAFQSNYSNPNLRINNIKLGKVAQINKWAFQYVKDIENLSINGTGEGLKIQDNAFEGVTVDNVYLDNVARIGSGAFIRINSPVQTLIITGVANGLEIADYAFQNNYYYQDSRGLSINDIRISNLSKLGKWSFQYVYGINNINIKGIENGAIINESAFQNASIENINLTNISEIGKYAFQVTTYNSWGSNLTNLNISCVNAGCTIKENAFEGNSELEDFTIQSNGVLEFKDYAFLIQGGQTNGKLKSFTLTGNISNLKIGAAVFQNHSLTGSIRLPNNLTEIGNYAFLGNQLEKVVLFDYVGKIGSGAFDWNTKVLITRDLSTVDYKHDINMARGYRVNYLSNVEGYDNYLDIIESGTTIETPYVINRPGYEFTWYEQSPENPFDFANTLILSDKTLNAKWTSLEEKVAKSEEKVSVLNNTTVTVGDAVEDLDINATEEVQLVAKDVKGSDVSSTGDSVEVQDSEIQANTNQIVEYQGGVEVYLELSNEKVEGTAKFSKPVAVKIPVANSSKNTVKVQVKHDGDDFGYVGLTLNPENTCIDGEPEKDQYNGEEFRTTTINGVNYATIYTCSASTFVAYTEKAKVYPSAGGGRSISTSDTQKTKAEQEHNSADTEETTEQENTKTTPNQTTNTQSIQEKVNSISNKSLTRGEVAVMTNILLEVYPQLTEGKTKLNEVNTACSNYADEQDFTKDEKKAITRLCRLSIMGIHSENNEPLNEFLVKEKASNGEFATIMDRVVSNYNEKDLSVIKDALKKLEGDDENVVFGTVYDVFMNIKSIFN